MTGSKKKKRTQKINKETFTSMVPLPSATLHPDIRKGSLACFWTCKKGNLSSDKKKENLRAYYLI